MRILFTAFCGTSAERLLSCFDGNTSVIPGKQDLPEDVHLCGKQIVSEALLIENNKPVSVRQLESAMREYEPDYIFSFGQRPNIKNKIHIETTARSGEEVLTTAFPCEELKEYFCGSAVEAKLSRNAGTSYCNYLYFRGLRMIKESLSDRKMVFIHIPFEKNISDFQCFAEQVSERIISFITAYAGRKDIGRE